MPRRPNLSRGGDAQLAAPRMVTSAIVPRRPIRKVDREVQKERSEWRAGPWQERRLILQKQPLFEIAAMGPFRPVAEMALILLS